MAWRNSGSGCAAGQCRAQWTERSGRALPSKTSRSPQGKQRQARRDGWKTQRRQVRGRPRIVCSRIVPYPKSGCRSAYCASLQFITVPGGAVLRSCKKTKRKIMAHLKQRAETHSHSLFVLLIFQTCLVGYPTPGYPSAPVPPQAPDAAPLPPLPQHAPAQPTTVEWDCSSHPRPSSSSLLWRSIVCLILELLSADS
ncbi:hypothetical protein HaLaN_00496 [Haematococcus lacustris]|uniref:Uncharacterized protein n=1 Tax=Haematococcus lacustris TaxID=44745 RepID=A0A699Y700_HAELA|nr:hypothetical protein HaLaN_00496 [Haematococcus lacustris]